MIYEKAYALRHSECDGRGFIKPSALLGLLQEAAADAAEEQNFGASFLNQRNASWFLLKYRIELPFTPRVESALGIRTESRGAAKFYAYRTFELSSEDGSPLGRVLSVWALVAGKKMVPPPSLIEGFPAFEARPNDLAAPSLRPGENLKLCRTFTAGFEDIDRNGHVNNGCYLRWALDALDYPFLAAHRLRSVDIAFKREAAPGAEIISEARAEGLRTFHTLSLASGRGKGPSPREGILAVIEASFLPL